MKRKSRRARRPPPTINVPLEKLKARISDKFNEFKDDETMNNMLLEAKWREIMANDYLEKQKGTIDKIKAEYQLALDRCDAIVIRLQDWAAESEQQYQFNLRSHRQTLEKLLDLSQKRLKTEQQNWETKLKTMVDEYEKDRFEVISKYEQHVKEVVDIENAISHEYSDKKEVLENKYRLEKDTLTMKNQEAISALTMHLKEQISQVNEEMKLANKDYKDKSENKMTQFHQLFEEHKNQQRKMRENEKIIAKRAADISHWRRKIKTNEQESKAENDRLRQEKETLSLHFRELKEVMAQFRNNEAKKLAEVSVLFEDANTEMTKKLTLAENILKYAEMNRKLETEREQIMPFPPSIAETDPEISRQMKNFKLQLKGDSKFVDESDMFDNFYRRYNKVLLETLSLEREKKKLDERNRYLRGLITKYMNGLAVKDDVLNQPNTLVIVNQNTNAPKGGMVDDVIPIRDVNLTVQAAKLQGY